MYRFDAEGIADEIVRWIRSFFDNNGKDSNAVVAISGGKDSSVTAAICVAALGADRVLGVLLPNGEQEDIDKSYLLVNHLGIKHITINIKDIYDAAIAEIEENVDVEISRQTIINLPARIRMAMTYAVSQSVNGRVANTCNLSEDWVGYSTRYGDAAGDFSPLAKLTVQEVKAVGRVLRLPEELVEKVPIDGLTGLTDEENLGFSYEVLDNYIRTGICDDPATKELIDQKHRLNKFKLEPMPTFPFDAPVNAYDD
ncbi:MAG: NAD(+) synthase [Firmicutes bacterium]|nr:NAD(+) synthase [Bacillota bacterium]